MHSEDVERLLDALTGEKDRTAYGHVQEFIDHAPLRSQDLQLLVGDGGGSGGGGGENDDDRLAVAARLDSVIKEFEEEVREFEARKQLREKEVSHIHRYMFGSVNEASRHGFMGVLRAARDYFRSSLANVVLFHFLMYFGIQLAYTSIFYLFPSVGTYMMGLKFGEESFLISIIIGSYYAVREAKIMLTFSEMPQQASDTMVELASIASDLKAFSAVNTATDVMVANLMMGIYDLHELSGDLMGTYYCSESDNRKIGEQIIIDADSLFEQFATHYSQAAVAAERSQQTAAVPDRITYAMQDLRKRWMTSRQRRLWARLHQIVQVHVDFFVHLYMYTIIPFQTFGALSYVGLVVFPMTLMIFNIVPIIYKFIGNPFDSHSRQRRQKEDFIKTEDSYRTKIRKSFLAAAEIYRRRLSPPPIERGS